MTQDEYDEALARIEMELVIQTGRLREQEQKVLLAKRRVRELAGEDGIAMESSPLQPHASLHKTVLVNTPGYDKLSYELQCILHHLYEKLGQIKFTKIEGIFDSIFSGDDITVICCILDSDILPIATRNALSTIAGIKG